MLAVNLKKIRWQHRIQYLGNIFTFAQLRGVTAGQMSPFLHIPAQARGENSYGGHPMMQEIMRKITNATNILIRVPYSSKFRVLVQASSSSSSHSSISSSPFFSIVSINSWAELSTRAAMCLCSAWSCRWPSLYLYVRNRSDSSFNTIKTTHHYGRTWLKQNRKSFLFLTLLQNSLQLLFSMRLYQPDRSSFATAGPLLVFWATSFLRLCLV